MVALFAQQSNIIDFPMHGKDEWYTPKHIIDAARSVMGGAIDLDPASCKEANKIVKASHYYTKEQNGLTCSWKADRLWLNPPFGRQNAPLKGFGGGKSIMGIFVSRLVEEYKAGNAKQAITLVTAKIDASWFAQLWEYPICFTTQRVLFTRPNQAQEGHFFGTALAYLGPNEQKFIETFSQFGRIARAIDTPKPSPVNLTLWNGGDV